MQSHICFETPTSRKLRKSQLRRRISSGGKSLVPLGGLTSILRTSSVVGVAESAPGLPLLPLLSSVDCVVAADDKEDRFLRFIGNGGLGIGNLRMLLKVRDEDEKWGRERKKGLR